MKGTLQVASLLAAGLVHNVVHIGTHVRISEKPLSTFVPTEQPSLLARSDWS